MRQRRAIGGDAGFSAEHMRRIRDDEATSSPIPSEIIANTVPARLVITQPTTTAKPSPPIPPNRGMKEAGSAIYVRPPHSSCEREEATEAVVNGVAERQQTGLTEQNVVG